MQSSEPTALLNKIASLQSTGTRQYAAGLFPSQRFHLYLPFEREDNNIFFTALTVFTLQNIKTKLSEKDTKMVDEITEKAVTNYEDYRNKYALKTYNFWRTDGSPHFPNGWFLRHIQKVRIPDDVDDTSLIYLTRPHAKEDVQWLKKKLIEHSNQEKRDIQNTFEHYRELKAYSTFFGEKMFIEFDVCVLCNLLYLIMREGLPLNEHDRDSIKYIRSVIFLDEHLNQPFYVSHSYPNSAVILYHIARLIARFDVPGLNDVHQKVISDLKALNNSATKMEQLLINTSLKRLGEKVPDFDHQNLGKKEIEHFSFFHAGMITAFESPQLYKMAHYKLFHLKYKCAAHSYALVLENKVL